MAACVYIITVKTFFETFLRLSNSIIIVVQKLGYCIADSIEKPAPVTSVRNGVKGGTGGLEEVWECVAGYLLSSPLLRLHLWLSLYFLHLSEAGSKYFD